MSLNIHTKDLIKSYHNRTVVDHVSVHVEQGEIVGLLGPNGAGKTTTFYMVVGLIKPDEGSVFLDDIDITKLAMYKRAQMGIGYLPQEASVFRKLSVEDNIKAILEMTGLSKQQQKDKLEALLDEFRLHHVRKNNGDSLSGGERRRTEIARALAVDPKFMLLDEPFAGVDPIAVEDIQSVVARLKQKNIGILITDHNVNETLSICDRAYLLIEGKIFKHGTAEELANDEQVRRLYLGRNFELKRKDYLHEEAKGNFEVKPDKLEYVVGNLIQETETIINTINEQHISSASSLNMNYDFDSYLKFFSETKDALLAYGSKTKDKKITEVSSQLKILNLADYWVIHENSVVLRLDGYRYIEKFKDDMNNNKAILNKLLLFLQNPAFEGI